MTHPVLLPLTDLDAFEAQQDALTARRLQAVAWEVLRFWESFPEVDRMSLSVTLPDAPPHKGRTGPAPSSERLDLEWSMSARDGRDKLEEYVRHAAVGESPWDRGHASTGRSSPYGAWATNRLMRWGPGEHTSVRQFLIELGMAAPLDRENPVAPLVHLLEQHLPGGAAQRRETAQAWSEQANAWCVAQEQTLLRAALHDHDGPAATLPVARPRGRL